MQHLDDAVLSRLLRGLPAASLAAVAQVDTRFRRLVTFDEELWREAFRCEFGRHYSARQEAAAGVAAATAHVALPAGGGWRNAYCSRLQHEARWRSGALGAPPETLRSHSGPVFGTSFVGPPFAPGMAISAGVRGPEETAELTLWELGQGQYEHVGRLGWQLPSAGMANLCGLFDARQRPGTMQVVLCGFGSDVNIATVQPLPSRQRRRRQQEDPASVLQLQLHAGPAAGGSTGAAHAGGGGAAASESSWPSNGSPAGDRSGSSGGSASSAGNGSNGSASSGDGGSSPKGSRDGSRSGRPRSAAAFRAAAVARTRAEVDVDVGNGSATALAPLASASPAAAGVDLSDPARHRLLEMSNLKHCPVLPDRLSLPGPGYTLSTVCVLSGHSGAAVTASPQADWLATSSFDGTVKLWRMPDAGLETSSSEGSGDGAEPAAVPVLAAAATYADPAQPPNEVPPPINSVALSRDCTRLSSGSNDRQLKLWDLERCVVTERLEGHSGWVWNLMGLEDDHSMLASGATDGTVRMWDARAGAQAGMVQVSTASQDNVYPIGGLDARLDGLYLVAGCFDGHVYVIDRRQLKVLHTLSGHTDRVTRVSVQGDTILSGSFDGTVCHWQL